MTAPVVTPVYAALLALLFLLLAVRTIRLRRALQVAIGDAGDARLQRAMRVHANFAEYVPLTLLLVLMLELQGAHPLLLHVLCACLLAGRLVHAWGVSRDPEDYRYRMSGMALTFTAMVGAALAQPVFILLRVTG
jgi:uncharacterized membrane protein YecN with MAPEG domain